MNEAQAELIHLRTENQRLRAAIYAQKEKYESNGFMEQLVCAAVAGVSSDPKLHPHTIATLAVEIMLETMKAMDLMARSAHSDHPTPNGEAKQIGVEIGNG